MNSDFANHLRVNQLELTISTIHLSGVVKKITLTTFDGGGTVMVAGTSLAGFLPT